MRKSSKPNQIADRIKNISACADLVGRKVSFQILIIGKTRGRARPYFETRIGNVKEVQSSLVVIEGSRGELYNRPIDKVTLLGSER